MSEQADKPKVVTTKKACELLECSRQTFYKRYRHQLKPYMTQSEWQNLYMLSDVEELMKSKDRPEILKDYELIE